MEAQDLRQRYRLDELASPQLMREVRKSPYWRDGGPPMLRPRTALPRPENAPAHWGKFAPKLGPRPFPAKVYKVDEPCPWEVKETVNTLQGINLVTGHLGAGKSYYAMRKIREYVKAGKYVMINFDLIVPWYSVLTDATYSFKERRKIGGMKDRYQRMRYIMRHVYRFDDQSELYDWTLPGDPDKEDRGLLVVDEAGLRNNSRTWKEREDRAKDQTGDKLAELEFMVHMRKLGWTCLMLTQDSAMVDKQLQGTTSNEIHLRNLQKVKLPMIGIPVSRKPFFIAVNYYHEGRSKMINGRESYGLDKRLANCYKSNYRFSRRDEVKPAGVRLMFDWERDVSESAVPFDPRIPVVA